MLPRRLWPPCSELDGKPSRPGLARRAMSATFTMLKATPRSALRCKEPVIVRDWYQLLDYRLTPQGNCRGCGGAIAGRFVLSPEAGADGDFR